MANTSSKDWSEYYKITKAKPPSLLLVEALSYLKNKKYAIDIGGGALKDTRFLLEQGFDVTVIDKSPLLEQEVKTIINEHLHWTVTSCEDFSFGKEKYDIASSVYTLPFVKKDAFETVFSNIKESIKRDGIFCGQFFGVRDEWSQNPKMTFHTKEQVEALLTGLEVIKIKEEETDSTTADGTPKHWHIFHVIARKQN